MQIKIQGSAAKEAPSILTYLAAKVLYIPAASLKFCTTGSQSSYSKAVTSWLDQLLELKKAMTLPYTVNPASI
jgi:hypothetical protein